MMLDTVAPFVGAWIETSNRWRPRTPTSVAPFVGAWIETDFFTATSYSGGGRTLRGCVD